VKRKPPWLKVPLPWGKDFANVRKKLKNSKLHTVCEAAKCPNIGECFNLGTATFLLMGDICTRHCTFCNINSGNVLPLDLKEPENVARAVCELKLKFAVLTSVTRDDLPDGGASHFAQTIDAIKQMSPKIGIEVLIPDFGGLTSSLDTIIKAKPDVINHNIETVKRLYPAVRPEADYEKSLTLLNYVSENSTCIVKSGLMLGLGETKTEVLKVLKDLQNNGCKSLTIGQYLPPSPNHYPLAEYIEPQVFAEFKKAATEAGFEYVMSSPLVRSSYHAGDPLL